MVFTMNRRARQRLDTEAEIIDAAEALVVNDPESLSIHAVARAIGVTPGALYRYFEGIDAIIAQVQMRVLTDLFARIEAGLARVPAADPLARVAAACDAMIAFSTDQPTRYAMLSRMLAVPRPLMGDEAAGNAMRAAGTTLGIVRTHLSAAREAGALGPGDDNARVLALWAAVHGAIQLDKLRRFAPEIRGEAVARTAVDGLLMGWGASAAAIARAREGSCR